MDNGLRQDVFDMPCGATWKRVDLHLHSPVVPSFRGLDGVDPRTSAGRELLIEKYVDQLAHVGIEVGAITDYNQIHDDWFKPLRDRAAERGITLLPGVEVSMNAGKRGLHVLAIFEDSVSSREVHDVLGALRRDPTRPLINDEKGGVDIDLDDHVVTCLTKLRDRLPCLLIAAHPEQSSGLLKSFQPKEVAKIIGEVAFDAIEHCSARGREQIRSTEDAPTSVLQRLAFVEFSDPKGIDEVGRKVTRSSGEPRATYMKLSATDIPALRLALHDPETRVHVGKPPSEPAHPRILAVEVIGSGFLGGIHIHWNADLNNLIGGRGTGKSAILESVRYALDLPPYHTSDYHFALVSHAVGSGGRVTVTLERPSSTASGHRYEVRRVLGEPAKVFDPTSGKAVPVEPIDVFGPGNAPLIFGQREIQTVASDERQRLALIDDIVGDDARRTAQKVRAVRAELEANAGAIAGLRQRLERRNDDEQELARVRHEMEVFEREGVAEKLKYHTALAAGEKRIERAHHGVVQLHERWRDHSIDAGERLNSLRSDIERDGVPETEQLKKTASDTMADLVSALDDIQVRADAAFTTAGERLSTTVAGWRQVLASFEDDLNRLRQELHSDSLDPDRLLRLSERRNSLEPLVEEYRRIEQELETRQARRRELLTEYRDRRHEEFDLRRRRCTAVTGRLAERLRLNVEFKGEKDGYRRAVAAFFRGSGLNTSALDALVEPTPTDGLAIVEATVSGGLTDAFHGLTPAMAQKVTDWLADGARRSALELLVPTDLVQIELDVEGRHRTLNELSLGQRATAILLLLFAMEGRPLILDQPEDDLDNRFISEDVVTLLREAKGIQDLGQRRQIIAATHNANIPVLGDAELVLTLEVEDGHAVIVDRGSIDAEPTRHHIRTILEGGEDAFRRRREKYGDV